MGIDLVYASMVLCTKDDHHSLMGIDLVYASMAIYAQKIEQC
jgi:hypothetical protein